MTATPQIIDPDSDTQIIWSNVLNSETPEEARWSGGEGYVEVIGTYDSATVDLQFASASGGTFYTPDTDAAPGGARFTVNAIAAFDLPIGYLKPSISGGGGSQSVTITVRPKR